MRVKFLFDEIQIGRKLRKDQGTMPFVHEFLKPLNDTHQFWRRVRTPFLNEPG